jgi:hypothetical protein
MFYTVLVALLISTAVESSVDRDAFAIDTSFTEIALKIFPITVEPLHLRVCHPYLQKEAGQIHNGIHQIITV